MVTVGTAAADDAGVANLVAAHRAFCRATAPEESCHHLPLSALAAPDVTLFAARDGGALCGIGALKTLGPEAGEIKCMHTAETARGRGVGAALLRHILAEASARGMKRLWLETGTAPAFAPARALYRRMGFAPCPPFGTYVTDPNSLYMTRRIAAKVGA